MREQLARSLPPPLMLRSNQLLDSLKAGQTDANVPAPCNRFSARACSRT
jgi:hypothetical protein